MMNLLNALTDRISKQRLTASPAQRRAVESAYRDFALRHPRWAESLFDLTFLNGRGAPIVQGYLEGTSPTAGEKLARAYLDEIQTATSRRSTAMATVLPIDRSFLEQFGDSVRPLPTAPVLPTRQA
jgi:hypothetical protein